MLSSQNSGQPRGWGTVVLVAVPNLRLARMDVHDDDVVSPNGDQTKGMSRRDRGAACSWGAGVFHFRAPIEQSAKCEARMVRELEAGG